MGPSLVGYDIFGFGLQEQPSATKHVLSHLYCRTYSSPRSDYIMLKLRTTELVTG